jgi:hypothetical protein
MHLGFQVERVAMAPGGEVGLHGLAHGVDVPGDLVPVELRLHHAAPGKMRLALGDRQGVLGEDLQLLVQQTLRELGRLGGEHLVDEFR